MPTYTHGLTLCCDVLLLLNVALQDTLLSVTGQAAGDSGSYSRPQSWH